MDPVFQTHSLVYWLDRQLELELGQCLVQMLEEMRVQMLANQLEVLWVQS